MRNRPRMRVHAAAAALVAVIAVAAAACTTLIGVDDYHLVTGDAAVLADALVEASGSPVDSGATSPPGDATLPDSAAADAAVDGAADVETSAPVDATGPENLVTNPGFENEVVNGNCGIGWQAYENSTLASSSVAHGGNVSCMICNPTTKLGYLGFDFATPDAGSVLFASAYFSGIANADGGFATVEIGLSVCYSGCSPQFTSASSPDMPSQWVVEQGPQVTVDRDATSSQLQMSVSNGCVLIDDVSVVAE